MESMEDAERHLARSIEMVRRAARVAGYRPEWTIILERLGVDLKPTADPDQAGPTPHGTARQQFDCVSVPATSLLLAATAPSDDVHGRKSTSGQQRPATGTLVEVYARPGPKPTPRQEDRVSNGSHRASSVSKPRKSSGNRGGSFSHIRCHKCLSYRSGGKWRRSVLGVRTPALCLSCYGKAYRSKKQERRRET
ncbi:hypothetical protein CF319_g6214 [Tilletia indica]|nr:hypothetical protein CF319_g6214 [Tilletia indica]